MRKSYKISDDDLDALWTGKVKYIISHYDRLGYGWRPKLWQVIFWRLRSRYCKNTYSYEHYFQYYDILVCGSANDKGVSTWCDQDFRDFIRDKNLQNGDVVHISYTVADSSYCMGLTDYVIIENGWKRIRSYL